MRPRNHWLLILLRCIVYGAVSAVFAWPLTTYSGVLGASIGGVSGALLAYMLSATRLRTPAIAVLIALIILILLGALDSLTDQIGLAQSLGPQALLNTNEAVFWAITSTGFATLLAICTLRIRALTVLEIAAVIVAFSQLVAAHRYGAIHRPFELADPILLRGGDPSSLLLVIGAIAALLMATLLIKEQRVSRLFAQLGLLGALVLVTFFASQNGGIIPHPEAPDAGLGLRGEGLDADRITDKAPTNWVEQLEFRDQYGGSGFPAPLAVVLFHDDYSPPGGVYYFRQGSFSQFNGRRLIANTRQDIDIDLDIADGFSPVYSEVREAPGPSDFRSSIESTVALMADHTRPFALESAVSFTPANNPNPDRFRRAYRAQSMVLTSKHAKLLGQQAGHKDWSEQQWQHYLQLPDDPRYTELAQEIVAELPPERSDDAMLRANTVQRWLAKQGIYSLRSSHSNASDPTANFLFGDKIGYCVHFAHAATYLLRSMGLPTRVSSGYMIAESARQGGSTLLLTSGNAHAWPEIYLRDVGWVVIDILPERTLDQIGTAPDAELQRLLGQFARGTLALPDEVEVIPTSFASLWRWFSERFGKAMVIVLMAGLLFCYLIKAWRVFAPMFARESAQPRLFYRRELDRLSELGVNRRPGESHEAFAKRLKPELPSLIKLAAVHEAAAFGSRRKTDSKQLRSTVSTLHTELRKSFPFYRRLLGWLTPWSWVYSR
ncbi:MAG: transglutaminase domain-containing protein [Granulosicoccus sp.]|nr:transglutaminase domain-containing protein [Granulosicoccus sp.]